MSMPLQSEARPRRMVLITGMSGAGRTSALRMLEDLGFTAVDNMPLALLGALAAAEPATTGDIAVGVDIRTRDFGLDVIQSEAERLAADGGFAVTLVFVDASDEVLQRRFTETRRRHPLAQDRPVLDGVAQERKLLAELREHADYVIDTSDFATGDLARQLSGLFGSPAPRGLSVFLTSFSYRKGLPRDADLVFDVRFLRNPYYDAELKPLTGLNPLVGAYILRDDRYAPFIARLTDLLDVLLPAYLGEGKHYLTIAFGCTGGRHRSVFIAEQVAAWLREGGRRVDVTHRDADKA